MRPFAQLARSRTYWLSQLQNRLFGTVERFRLARGWNRTQLADHLGVSKGYLSQIMNGDFDHRLSKLIELSLAVGVVPNIQFTPIDTYVADYLSGYEGTRDVARTTATIVVTAPVPPAGAPTRALLFDTPTAIHWRADASPSRYAYA